MSRPPLNAYVKHGNVTKNNKHNDENELFWPAIVGTIILIPIEKVYDQV